MELWGKLSFGRPVFFILFHHRGKFFTKFHMEHEVETVFWVISAKGMVALLILLMLLESKMLLFLLHCFCTLILRTDKNPTTTDQLILVTNQ